VNFRAFVSTRERPANIHQIDMTAHGPLSSVVERVTRNDEVGCSIQPAGNHFTSFWMSMLFDPLYQVPHTYTNWLSSCLGVTVQC
jgi:hypothetical protein